MAAPGDRVVVLHTEVPPEAGPEAQDTLTQVREVSTALCRLGLVPRPVPASLRLDLLRERLLALRPRLVFNLVEALAEQDALLSVAPLVLETLQVPYTGSGPAGLVLTGDKLASKRLLAAAGVPVPELWRENGAAAPPSRRNGPWIIKSVWQQASFGLDDGSVVPRGRDVPGRLAERRASRGGAWYAERYVAGREFNLSLLETEGRVTVLPPAEVGFQGFPPGKPHIVGYAAKWCPQSPEYAGTVRTFEFPVRDAALLGELKALALRCWQLFGLRDYARVDLRVDARGRPRVLEVNANPCLSADAGFVAAAGRAGLTQVDVVASIVARAAAGGQHVPSLAPAVATERRSGVSYP